MDMAEREEQRNLTARQVGDDPATVKWASDKVANLFKQID
jgi:hypothetical protein